MPMRFSKHAQNYVDLPPRTKYSNFVRRKPYNLREPPPPSLNHHPPSCVSTDVRRICYYAYFHNMITVIQFHAF